MEAARYQDIKSLSRYPPVPLSRPSPINQIYPLYQIYPIYQIYRIYPIYQIYRIYPIYQIYPTNHHPPAWLRRRHGLRRQQGPEQWAGANQNICPFTPFHSLSLPFTPTKSVTHTANNLTIAEVESKASSLALPRCSNANERSELTIN